MNLKVKLYNKVDAINGFQHVNTGLPQVMPTKFLFKENFESVSETFVSPTPTNQPLNQSLFKMPLNMVKCMNLLQEKNILTIKI